MRNVRLTAKGRELVNDVFPAHTERVSRMFVKLTEEEKRLLIILCHKLAT